MKRISATAAIFIFLINGCSDLGSSSETVNPDWVKSLITQFENSPAGNPPQSIWKYDYKGMTVYYVPAQCCDMFSILYDDGGRILCFPDGGFSGRGDGKCPDFFQERKNEILIWRDTRKG